MTARTCIVELRAESHSCSPKHGSKLFLIEQSADALAAGAGRAENRSRTVFKPYLNNPKTLMKPQVKPNLELIFVCSPGPRHLRLSAMLQLPSRRQPQMTTTAQGHCQLAMRSSPGRSMHSCTICLDTGFQLLLGFNTF